MAPFAFLADVKPSRPVFWIFFLADN